MNEFIVFQLFLLVLTTGSITTAPQVPVTTSNAGSSEAPFTPSQTSQNALGTTPSAFGTTNSGPITIGTSNSAPNGAGTTGNHYSTSTTQPPTTTYLPTTPNPQDEKLSDCKTPPTLENYCGGMLPANDWKFFENSTSIMGLLSRIITPRVVYALQSQCKPGNWCLADSYHTSIAAGRETFYVETPFCKSDALWSCLEFIERYRRKCNETELFFLMSTVGVLCDMEVIDGGRIGPDCYTRAVEAMIVSYSDMSRTTPVDTKDKCSEYNKQMTNTYECAGVACDLEQRVFLSDFGPWTDIASNAGNVIESCNLTPLCQRVLEVRVAPAPTNTTEGNKNVTGSPQPDLQSVLTNAQNEGETIEEEIESVIAAEEAAIDSMLEGTTQTAPSTTNSGYLGKDERRMDMPAGDSEEAQTFVYGMVTVSVVVVVGLALIGILSFKKLARTRRNYKLGYSQMSEEESRMLKNEYN